MKKKYLAVLICVVLCCVAAPVFAVSKAQEAVIVDHCDTIKESLKTIQKSDARARVYLGGKYETILNKYVTPLNVSLVENSMSTPSFIESQNTLSDGKVKFSNDYVNYQQRLEELIAVDCKNNPGEFYDKLETTRQKRKKVEQDVQKIRESLVKYLELVKQLKDGLNVETK